MRVTRFLLITALACGGAFAQRGGAGHSSAPVQSRPSITGSFGSVIFPGSAPSEHRSFGNVVSGPRVAIPGLNDSFTKGGGYGGRERRGGGYGGGYLVPYPVYVGGYYNDYSAVPAYSTSTPPAEVVQPAPSNQVQPVIIYPQQTAPVIVQYGVPQPETPHYQIYEAPKEESSEAPSFLLAFKDGTIYSATNYWVNGDTIHYFTTGNKHNQASLSLIDRAQTAKLGRQTGSPVVLPAER